MKAIAGFRKNSRYDVLIYDEQVKTINYAAELFANMSLGDFNLFPEAIDFLDKKFGLENIFEHLLKVFPEFPYEDSDPKEVFDAIVIETKNGTYDYRSQ